MRHRVPVRGVAILLLVAVACTRRPVARPVTRPAARSVPREPPTYRPPPRPVVVEESASFLEALSAIHHECPAPTPPPPTRDRAPRSWPELVAACGTPGPAPPPAAPSCRMPIGSLLRFADPARLADEVDRYIWSLVDDYRRFSFLRSIPASPCSVLALELESLHSHLVEDDGRDEREHDASPARLAIARERGQRRMRMLNHYARLQREGTRDALFPAETLRSVPMTCALHVAWVRAAHADARAFDVLRSRVADTATPPNPAALLFLADRDPDAASATRIGHYRTVARLATADPSWRAYAMYRLALNFSGRPARSLITDALALLATAPPNGFTAGLVAAITRAACRLPAARR